MSVAALTMQPGAEIDGFTIGERVHRGGMATLWSVTHPGINVPLLMKVPLTAEGEDPAAIVSFEMEQMILPRLSGPHVPACFGTGDFERQAYVVMERIPGQTLYKRLDALPLPYEEVRVIGGKVATALASLHRQNVIHHDIKPSSIMFRERGEAVLIDFGLSHHQHLPDLLQEEFRLPYGTAPYMAPERLLGVRDDPRSDLFSLGVLLYFFTTGVRPFGETETLRGMRRRLWRDPYPPRKLRPDYPLWLQEIVLRCLEIDPAARYPTAAQLAFDLGHPEQVKLTARAQRLNRDPLGTVWAPPLQSRGGAAAAEVQCRGPARIEPDRCRRARSRRRGRGAERDHPRHRRAGAVDVAIGAARLRQRAETQSTGDRPRA
ncbi:serine/threonine protein kinase [Bradyrhizobium sp. USDA 4452]